MVADDPNDSDCYVCLDGGDLLCCDFCVRAFHQACLTPPLEDTKALPADDWACPVCSGFGQGRFGDDKSLLLGDFELKQSNGDDKSLLLGTFGMKPTVERLEGLSSPIAGKLSPFTPAQNGGGSRRASLRKRPGKSAAENVNGGESFEFKVEPEDGVDLRTPQQQKEKGINISGASSLKRVKLTASFSDAIDSGNDNNLPRENGVSLLDRSFESDEEDVTIASRKRKARGKSKSEVVGNGCVKSEVEELQSGASSGKPSVSSGGLSMGEDVDTKQVKKGKTTARKREAAEAEAGPSGSDLEAPAVELPAVEGRPRNRRRNRRAEAVPEEDEPAVPAGGNAEDQGDRARARFLAIARRRAAHFAHFAGDDHGAEAEEGEEEGVPAPGRQVAQDGSDQEEPDWPGPFSTARKLVRERGAAAAAREGGALEESATGPAVDWTPSRTVENAALFGRPAVPTLFDTCVRLLVDNAEFVESMEGIPDAVRKRVAGGFCARRKMIPETLSLFFQGCPGEIVLPDCTLVGEAEMTAAMAQTDAQRLEILDLGMCGRCITDQGLSATLAAGVNTLPQLQTLSLRGAYRLSDSAVEKLLLAAPGMTSLELRKCSLLTDDVIRMIADAIGGQLKTLSLEGCAQLDGCRLQPNLLRLSFLRRLNLSGVGNVTDALVQELGVTLGSGLEELSLAGAKELTDASVAALAACCPNLTLLDLDGLVKLTDVSIARLADGCRSLRHLSLKLGKFSDEALAAYVTASGSQLRHLSLNTVRKAGNATLVALAKHARDLASLDVSWCRRVSDEGLGLLADSCPHVRSVRLYGCSQITDAFLMGHSNTELVVLGRGDDVK